MNAIQLQKPDGTPVNVHLCGECNLSFEDKGVADRCCAPRICESCGLLITDEPGRTRHHACWLKWRFDEAEKLDNWDGFIYCGEIAYNNGYFDSIQDLIEYCQDTNTHLPEWAFVCKEVPFPDFELDVVISRVNDNSFEDAADQLNGLDELGAAIKAFNEANQGLISYEPDYKRVVLIKAT